MLVPAAYSGVWAGGREKYVYQNGKGGGGGGGVRVGMLITLTFTAVS